MAANETVQEKKLRLTQGAQPGRVAEERRLLFGDQGLGAAAQWGMGGGANALLVLRKGVTAE